MSRIKSHFIHLSILCWGIVGCTRNIEIVPEFEEGYIAGYVNCLDEYGKSLNPENVGILVYGAPEYNSATDPEGFFKIKVPIGYQHLVFQKEGLGSYHLRNHLIIGGHVPVAFNAALLCKPVDVEAIIDSTGLTNNRSLVYVAGKASSKTPFNLLIACYAEELPKEIKYFRLGTFDKPISTGYTCNYSGLIFIENFSKSTKTIYAAIYCQNAYDYIQNEGGTLKQVTNYTKINILK